MYKIKILKRITLLLVGIVINMNCFTQDHFPYGINYQAIARDINGNPLIGRDIVIQIQVIQWDTKAVLWEEEHYTRTNEFGLFQLIIGEGFSTDKGLVLDFNSINWAIGSVGIKVGVDFGEGPVHMGEVKLQSVPYAFLADSARKAPIPDMNLEQLNNVAGKKPTKNQSLIWNGNIWIPGDSLKISNVVIRGALKLGESDEIVGIISDPELDEATNNSIPTSKAVKDYVDSTAVQDLELIGGSTLRITKNASASEINLAPYTGSNTDEQILSLNNSLLSITNGNTVNLAGLIDDEDADPTNELQDLSFSNNILTITNSPNPTQIDLSALGAAEVDPVFLQSPAYEITQAIIDNWDNAFSWGDHALADYLTVEVDPSYTGSVAATITGTHITNWNNAFSWGNHALAGYLTDESDPIFTESDAAAISNANINNWNKAYSWGDHALAGYLTEEEDPIFKGSVAAGITNLQVTNWNNAFSWGDHALAGYVKNEVDPIFSSSPAAGITTADLNKWNNNSNYWSLSGSNLYVLNRHVGIGTGSPSASLHVANNDVVFTAPYTLPGSPGSPPVEGQGTRFMWYADKAAIRAGRVQGTNWNRDQIGNYSIAMGNNPLASGNSSIAMGGKATGDGSVALGGGEASGVGSVAIGSGSKASGSSSVAMVGGEAKTNRSIAIGTWAIANNSGSVAIGEDVDANGQHSTALGFQTVADGNYSTVMGLNTRTSGGGYGATAMGSGSRARGHGSTATGANSNATGLTSTAMGNYSESIGQYSTTTGNRTTATGFNSFAANMYTTAQSYASSVFGRYNIIAGDSVSWITSDPLFVIGNGSSNSNRNNALTIYKNGNTTIDGSVTADAFYGDGSGLTGVGGTQCLYWNKDTRYLSISGCGTSYYIEDKWIDADNDPDNEIQSLSLSGNTIYLSKGGGSVVLPYSSGGGSSWTDYGSSYTYSYRNIGINTTTPSTDLVIYNYAGTLEMDHKSLLIKSGAGDNRVELTTETGPGRIVTYGPNNSLNTDIGYVPASNNNGAVSVLSDESMYCAGMYVGNDAGVFWTKGPNDKLNFSATYLNENFTNNGYVAVYDQNETWQARMYVNEYGDGVINADIKNFRISHPNKAGYDIVYTSIEGPEAAAYVRGTTKLKDGIAKIEFPEHFQLIASENSITVQITPLSADSKGLAVLDKNGTGFSVKELFNGRGNYSFDWEVKCVRKGYEDYEVIQKSYQEATNLPQTNILPDLLSDN